MALTAPARRGHDEFEVIPAGGAAAGSMTPGRPRRAMIIMASLVAAAGLVIAAAVVAPAAASAAPIAPMAKPDNAGGGNGGGGGKGNGNGNGNGGGGGTTTELSYAAIGDSYAAGVGAGSYDGTSCDRSSKSYPKVLDAGAELQLTAFPACSGSDTVEVRAQVSAVPGDADVVTVTVGGNDVGFAAVMQNCFVLPNENCQSYIDTAAAIANSVQFQSSLAAVIGDIRAKTDPDATIVVTGYPLLFWLNSSGVNPKYTWADEVNAQTVVLNDVIQSVAVTNGASFVDVEDDFDGHGIGSSDPWINDWRWFNPTPSFHPNATGYVAYAGAIAGALNG